MFVEDRPDGVVNADADVDEDVGVGDGRGGLVVECERDMEARAPKQAVALSWRQRAVCSESGRMNSDGGWVVAHSEDLNTRMGGRERAVPPSRLYSKALAGLDWQLRGWWQVRPDRGLDSGCHTVTPVPSGQVGSQRAPQMIPNQTAARAGDTLADSSCQRATSLAARLAKQRRFGKRPKKIKSQK